MASFYTLLLLRCSLKLLIWIYERSSNWTYLNYFCYRLFLSGRFPSWGLIAKPIFFSTPRLEINRPSIIEIGYHWETTSILPLYSVFTVTDSNTSLDFNLIYFNLILIYFTIISTIHSRMYFVSSSCLSILFCRDVWEKTLVIKMYQNININMTFSFEKKIPVFVILWQIHALTEVDLGQKQENIQ